MKILLYVVGCAMILLAFAVAVMPGPAGHMSPMDTIGVCVMLLISAVCISAGGIIAAIEKLAR